MKKGKLIALIASIIVVLGVGITLVIVLTSNKENGQKTYYDNENDALVFSTLEVDGVFNPFFTTSGTDSTVVGMTQIGMLGNDSAGLPTWGDEYDVITKDLQITTVGEGDDAITTYLFVLKNNVRFSNGSYLTIKDVLFNYYVYLDPVYSGSSTIYSTDIVGLKEYRTQAASENEQDSFLTKFQIQAKDRIDVLVEAKNDIFDEHDGSISSASTFLTYLEAYQESYRNTDYYDAYKNLVKDYNQALNFFREELEDDYSNSLNSYQDMVFQDSKNNVYHNLFTTDVEVFLYNEGYISWNKKDAKLESSLVNDVSLLKNYTKTQALNIVYGDKVPKAIDEIVLYWATSTKLFEYITNEVLEEYYQNNNDRQYKNISGIKFINKDEAVIVNGKEYSKVEYDENGNVIEGFNEVLSISIHGVDPKAIWNFGIGVAPMYYYSDQEHIDAFDFESNFGVEYASQTFMNQVVKDPNKIGVPVGAGAYAASKASGGIENVSAGDFLDKNVIYYERNPYYLMGEAVIKKVRFQVVSAAQMLNSLYNAEVDFVEPNAKPDTVTELENKKQASASIDYKTITTSGYGYIGVNAAKVKSMYVRQAIMHTMNTQACVDYYQNMADPIYRSMSKASWAYPKNATSYYPYIASAIPEDLDSVSESYREFVIQKGKSAGEYFTKEEQYEFIKSLVEKAGYTLNAQGIYSKDSDILKFTFTIAGAETDHPAYNAFLQSQEILNACGFNITVTTDANALKKLATGALTVWAAAWGSTIDPDMYQVYHKDSNATSVLNWGYKAILQNTGGKYSVEKAIVEELSDLIEEARKTDNQELRASIYSRALDLVMELAVELPTYQRSDLFAYNINKIDDSTLTADEELSPYKGLTSELYLVSLNVEK